VQHPHRLISHGLPFFRQKHRPFSHKDLQLQIPRSFKEIDVEDNLSDTSSIVSFLLFIVKFLNLLNTPSSSIFSKFSIDIGSLLLQKSFILNIPILEHFSSHLQTDGLQKEPAFLQPHLLLLQIPLQEQYDIINWYDN
jgi:hypothetical protein